MVSLSCKLVRFGGKPVQIELFGKCVSGGIQMACRKVGPQCVKLSHAVQKLIQHGLQVGIGYG